MSVALISVVVVSVIVMSMTVVLWAQVLHLHYVPALDAASNGAVTGDYQPDLAVSVGWDAAAANLMFFAKGWDDNGFLHCS
jgi:hypothetical protein